jgi:hypothetical protein
VQLHKATCIQGPNSRLRHYLVFKDQTVAAPFWRRESLRSTGNSVQIIPLQIHSRNHKLPQWKVELYTAVCPSSQQKINRFKKKTGLISLQTLSWEKAEEQLNGSD